MKNLILSTLVLILSITCGYTQQVPEKSNAIIVAQSDSIGLREKVLKVLANKDYTSNSSKTAAVITTAAKTLKNGTRVAFNFQTKGNEIIITGSLPVAGQSTMKIAFQGKKGSPTMNGWEEMEKIAKAFGGTVRYEIK